MIKIIDINQLSVDEIDSKEIRKNFMAVKLIVDYPEDFKY